MRVCTYGVSGEDATGKYLVEWSVMVDYVTEMYGRIATRNTKRTRDARFVSAKTCNERCSTSKKVAST